MVCPLLGKYELKLLEYFRHDQNKHGMLLLEWEHWLTEGTELTSNRPFGILLPQTTEACLAKGKKAGTTLSVACARALSDPSTRDVTYTFFDHMSKASQTVTKCLIQMGHGHVHRVTGDGLPAPTFVVKQKVKVLIELSLAEFKENNVEDRWKNFRGNDAAFLRAILYDLLPADSILELPKKASWYHSGTAWEAATATVVLTRKGYSIFSKKAADRLLFPRLFIGNLVGEASIADGGPALDEHWEMLWCQESFSKVLSKCQRIPANYFGGIRHKRGKDWDTPAFLYGWHIFKE